MRSINGQRKGFIAALLGVSALLVGCGVSLYTPTEANVNKRTPATLAELQEGRTLYRERCGNCHALHRPEEFDADAWKKYVNKMQPKAKITDEQKDVIYKYLVNS